MKTIRLGVLFILLALFFHKLSYGQGAYRLSIETKAIINPGSDTAKLDAIYLIYGSKKTDQYVHGGIQWSRDPTIPPFVYTSVDSTRVIGYLDTAGRSFSAVVNSFLPNTLYYVRACLYAGDRSSYTPFYGNVVTFRTLHSDGSLPIIYNQISSRNQLLCSNINTTVSIEAPVPTGGLPGDSTYNYLWQQSYSGLPNSWTNAKGTDSNKQNYRIATDLIDLRYEQYYRRTVSSGLQRDTSSAIKVTYLGDSIQRLNKINISLILQNNEQLRFKAEPLLFSGNFKTLWQQLDTSVSTSYDSLRPINYSRETTISNPNDRQWYRAITVYSDSTNNCPNDTSSSFSFTKPDGSGIRYPIVEIGSQYWMINNIRTKKYLDGSDIPLSNQTDWFSNDSAAYILPIRMSDSLKFGALYNQFVISDSAKSICPEGYRIPSSVDWVELIEITGEFPESGRNLKSTMGWLNNSPNDSSIGTNSYNFNGTSAGRINGIDGSFSGQGDLATWWEVNDSNRSDFISIFDTSSILIEKHKTATIELRRMGRSIRCMRHSDGSSIIVNNHITTNDTSICVSRSFVTPLSILATEPTGGVNNRYNYHWEKSSTGEKGTWTECSGNDSSKNLIYLDSASAIAKIVFLRRIVYSGLRVDTSNTIKIVFQVSGGLFQSKLNISQVAGNKDTLVLKGSIFGPITKPTFYWTESDVSANEQFTTNLSNDTLLTHINPGTATWLRLEAYGIDTNGNCVNNISKAVGFTAVDNDGNIYPYTAMGQINWMINNLRTTTSKGNPSLTQIDPDSEWSSINSPAYCWYDRNLKNKITKGALYNYYTILDSIDICPTGWYIPGVNDWTNLIAAVGGQQNASQVLRTNSIWRPFQGALDTGTNQFNFNALPGGLRFPLSQFYEGNLTAFWWLRPIHNQIAMGSLGAYAGKGATALNKLLLDSSESRAGYSIRCISHADGSFPIHNNYIETKDTVVCGAGTTTSRVTLLGSNPSGGLIDSISFSYLWQTANSAMAQNWDSAKGPNSDTNYIAFEKPNESIPIVWYRRKVTSGTQVSYSKAVSITYIDSNGTKGHIDLVNISQINSGSKSIVNLKYKSLPTNGIGIGSWYKSSTSDSSKFSYLGTTGIDSILIYKPDTNEWYYSTITYYDTVNHTCVADTSPVIGFTPPDGDYNYYAHTKIGDDYWTINNLRTTKDLYGNPIPLISDSALWLNASGSAYCWIHNNDINKISTGALYNYFASTMTDSLCPIGWKIPTLVDWLRLKRNAGNSSAGTALRTTYNWDPFQAVFIAGQNSFNFNAYPTGYRLGEAMSSHNSTFRYSTSATFWWVNKAGNSGNQYHIYYVTSKTNDLPESSEALNNDNKRRGLPIRCVKK